MSTLRSYAVLTGQLLLVLAGALLVSWVVQELGGPAPHVGVLTAGTGTALVLASARARRIEGATRSPALTGCQVLLPVDRWPVGGLWQSRLRPRTRAGWAPGVLGLAPGRAVFAPSRDKDARHAWQDVPRAVQLRGGPFGSATALRVHGRDGGVQLVAQLHPSEVRAAVEQVLPVSHGWEEPVAEPVGGDPEPDSVREEREPRLAEQGRAWPFQYSVRLLLEDSTDFRVEVVTWQHREQAETIARSRYGYLRPDGPAVREAVVVDIGPAPRGADGRPSLTGLAFDRGEW